MKTIEIKYRPIAFIPVTRTRIGIFPECWSDLTPAQLIAISHVQDQSLDDFEFLHQVTGISRSILKKLAQYQLWELGQGFGWVQEIKPHNKFIIPEINVGDARFYAPMDKLKKFQFGQFIFADSCFSDYQENKTEEELNRFIASMYLPRGMEFSDELLEINTPVISRVPLHAKEAIVLNYFLVKQWLSDVYPLVFQPSKQEEKPGKTTRSNNNGWIKIFEQIVGDDIINSDRYATLPLHNVLRFLSDRIKQNMKKH